MARAASERRIIEQPNPFVLAAALAPAVAVVLCLVLYPLALALWSSLQSAAGPSLARYVAFFAETDSYRALLRTLGLALATSAASILLSVPLGYIARAYPRLGFIIRVLVMLPLAVPVLVAAYALTLFYSQNGLFNNLLVHVMHLVRTPLTIAYTWTGLVIACTWRFFPYTALVVISALDAMDRSLEDAASSTGASPWLVFRSVTLPLIAPAALSGAILTFVSTFGTFSIPLLMGGQHDVLSVVAYRKATGAFDWPGAATVVLVMAVVQIAVLVRAAARRRPLDPPLMRRSRAPLLRRFAAGVLLVLFAGFIFGPLLVLALWSVAQQWFWPALVPTGFTLRWYAWAMVVPNVLHALKMSLLVASIVTLATTVCALPAAVAVARYRFRFRNLMRTLFSVPLLVPYISLGIGIASVFYTLHLNGTLLAVIMAHMIATLPFGILILTGAIEELQPEAEEAALSCGAPPSMVFRTILLPQLVPALLAQGVYVFMLSLDEFTLTLLVSSPDSATLPVQMFASIGEGYLQISSALAMMLLVPSLMLSLVIARFLRGSMTHVTA